MQDAKRATGRGAGGERHAIGVTRMCLRTGSVQLPFALAGRLPEGELLVHDVESDEPVVLWSEPPRRLAGLAPLFERHEVQVNDQVVLDLQGDEVRLSVAKRPRRSRPKVTPSTWASHRDEPPSRPPPEADAGDRPDEAEAPPEAPAGREGRTSRAAHAPGATEPAGPTAVASEAPVPPSADDVPRAPRIKARPRDGDEAAGEVAETARPSGQEPGRGPLAGLVRAARGWFGGRRHEDRPAPAREADWRDAWEDESETEDEATAFAPPEGRAAPAPEDDVAAEPADRVAARRPRRPLERRSDGPATEADPGETPTAGGPEPSRRSGSGRRPLSGDELRPRPERASTVEASRPGDGREGGPRAREAVVRDVSAPEPAADKARARADRDATPAEPTASERFPRPAPEPDTEHGTRPPATPLWPAWDEEPDAWVDDAAGDVDAATDALFRAPAPAHEADGGADAGAAGAAADAGAVDPAAADAAAGDAAASVPPPPEEATPAPTSAAASGMRRGPAGSARPVDGDDAQEDAAEPERGDEDRADERRPDERRPDEGDGPTLPSGVPLRAERFLGGDLRTRLVRFLASPDMPLIAKTEMIAKRFDLDPDVARDMLQDVAEDPPTGLRLTPVREGAWRIERTRS